MPEIFNSIVGSGEREFPPQESNGGNGIEHANEFDIDIRAEIIFKLPTLKEMGQLE